MIIALSGPRAADLIQHLERWSLTDESGASADRLSLTVNAVELRAPPASGGDQYKVTIGGEQRGEFEVSALKLKLHPRKWVIQLSPAKFQRKDPTGWREKRKRSWKPATVKDLVTAIMEPHGYQVRVDSELADLPTQHLNQAEETDKAFLSRVAQDFDAVAKPINNLFIFGKKGSVKALSGSPRGKIIIKPIDIEPGTGEINYPSAEVYKGVKAKWRETESGLNGQAVVGSAPFKLLETPYKSTEEATKKAEAELKRVTRNSQTFTASLKWKAGLFAEAIFNFSEEFEEPTLVSNWSFDRVSMSGTRTKLSVSVEASRLTN